MNEEMAEHLEFTRDDAERMTRMETLLKGMDEKMDNLVASIGACQTNCSGRRDRFDKRLCAVEDEQKVAKGFLKGRTADVALVIGILAVIGTIVSIWEAFH